MSSDPLLKAAIAHWGPRFVANGVVLTDFEEVTGSLSSYDDWCRAWSARAAHHEQLGREALARKHFLTAGECLQRAGVYYHFASFLFVRDVAQMKAAHKKQIECRQAALPHLRPPGERVEIPYQGKRLAGILRKPAGVERPPVVAMAVGASSNPKRHLLQSSYAPNRIEVAEEQERFATGQLAPELRTHRGARLRVS